MSLALLARTLRRASLAVLEDDSGVAPLATPVDAVFAGHGASADAYQAAFRVSVPGGPLTREYTVTITEGRRQP